MKDTIIEYAFQLREQHNQSAVCKDCLDTGRVTKPDGSRVFCRCFSEKIWFSRFKESKIPELYYSTDLVAWDTLRDGNQKTLTKAQQIKKQQVKKFIEHYIGCIRLLSGLPPQSLTLMRGNEPVKINSLKFTGGDGSGKTMLAAIVGMSAIKAGLSVKYLEWSDIVATMSDYEQRTEQNDIVAQCRESHVVIIDNIANTGLNWPYLKLQLERIAQARIKTGRPTILTFRDDYTEAEGQWKSLINSAFLIELPSSQGRNK